MWVESVLVALNRGTNQFQKDELFNLLQNIYEDYGSSVKYPWDSVLKDVAPFMEDPKTKIKIKALDSLALVALKSNKIEESTVLLEGLLSPVFFEMFTEKISKSRRNAERRQKINNIHAAVSETLSVSTPMI